ncbi:MAG: 3-hydroxyacyl-CoA dehydrogenase NAD-binding domain-containing protein [Deltaproteobacteria bacterium]|nr:3-hydroxyacyl-CoA dehydrogenase NAD-binding domain-containing protein [Deltaproteobacteria bacterium]
MPNEIKKVAVLGSGVMGSGIAGLLAGAGFPCLLLDIVPKGLAAGESRNKLALKGLELLSVSKPSLIYSKSDLKKITVGNFEDDWSKLAECDWIIEVVVEKLEIKRELFTRLEKVVRTGTIVSSNTSGLSLKSMTEGLKKEFKKNFVITHFFNPVRYMKLVELVSGPETDPEVTRTIHCFLEDSLGKGVVIAKDTPNFIANRIGVYSWFATLQEVLKNNYKVEEVDKILGSAMGRPKSAMFRTPDMVGLDTIVHVARHTYESCVNDEKREIFKTPPLIEKMVEKKWLGDKTGQGFYKKVKKEGGPSEILALDLQTLEYRPQEKVRYDSLGAIKNLETLSEKLKTLVTASDRAGELAWSSTRDMLVYAANRVPEIADDIVNVDNAMKWGFGWELGPFEIWDLLGVGETAERIRQEKIILPKIVEQLLQKGEGRFYKREKGKQFYFDPATQSYKPVQEKSGVIILSSLKEREKVVKQGMSASLIDIGDGVFCVEFHSKMNAIDDDIISMLNFGLDTVEKNGVGLVVTNEATNFSVGANLLLMFMEAQSKNWAGIDKVVRDFQNVNMRMKYSQKPVVVAPFGITLGGGCEVVLGAQRVRAHAELYMGLVEVGVGLIPAGGGCKEMVLRCERGAAGGPFPKIQKAFETIAFAKVSTSAKEAVSLGYLAREDRISLSRERLIADAKGDVLEMARNYQSGKPREDILMPGRGGEMAVLSAIQGFRLQGLITEHDAFVASKLAHILTAGDQANLTRVSEQHLLDLEREAFLSLIGTEKSQARMQAMLMTGKPLRN